VTTLLRPVLWRPAGAPVLRLGEKKSFFEHVGDAFDVKPPEEKKPAAAKTPAATPPAATAATPGNPEKAKPPGR
jgi:hypothetical protein